MAWTGAINTKSSCHEVTSEFFATKAPDPPHWTLNSYFGAFFTIRVALGPIGCHTTLSAKRVKLVQKFVPQSRVGIFRNECTRSTPLDPKLLFLYFLYYLGAFGTVWLPSNTKCKTGQTGGKVRAMKSRWNFSNAPDPPHWPLNSCSGAFHTNFGAFGTIWLARKNSVQNGPTGAKVRATKSHRNFTHRTHPILLIGL